MVPSILTDRKKKKVKSSNVVEEVSVAEGQKLRERVVAQELLGCYSWHRRAKTWEPEAQLVEDGWGPDIEVFKV